MDTYSAEVIEIDAEHFLSLKVDKNELKIPITKDEPVEIKKVFNSLILKLKKGPFNFSIKEKENGDIIYHVAKEYIEQLNSELNDIYKELEESDLLESDT
ncbi:MAG: hypothetical protein AB2826_26730 [Candidatus Thiodiazotropha sp.]